MRSPLFERFLKETTSLTILRWHYMEEKIWGAPVSSHYYRLELKVEGFPEVRTRVVWERARLCAGEECEDHGGRWPLVSVKVEDIPKWLNMKYIDDEWSVMQKFFRWRLKNGR